MVGIRQMSDFSSEQEIVDVEEQNTKSTFSKLDVDNLVANFKNEYTKSMANGEHVNILITGKSGAGKSTLINAIFGEHVAAAGTGRPVTQQTDLFESETSGVRIYDTKGLEIEGAAETFEDIKQEIAKQNYSSNPDGMIGVIWYVIAANAGRIEQTEIDFITELAGPEINVPVIVVLTKSDNPSEFMPLREEIELQRLNIAGIVNILAADVAQYHPVTGELHRTIPAYGLDKLVKKTYNVLPDLQKRAFANQQRADSKLRTARFKENSRKANSVILASAGAVFAEGFVPLPVADGLAMTTTQLAMMGKIASIYHISLEKEAVLSLVTGVVGLGGASYVGRKLFSSALKLIPVVGTITGGLVSGVTGAAVTITMGLGFVKLLEVTQSEKFQNLPFNEVLKQLKLSDFMTQIDPQIVKTMLSSVKKNH